MRLHHLRHLPAVALLATALPSSGLVAQETIVDRARAAVEARQVAGVKGELAAWAKANPRSHAGAFWMGRLLIVERDWEKASDWFERAVELEPRDAPSHFWLGNAYGEQAQRASKLRQPFLAKKVLREFERAVQLDPEYVDARAGLVDFYRLAPGIMGGGMDKAHAQVAEIRKRAPLRGAYLAATLAQQEKKLDVAAAEYETAIGIAPDSVGPYIQLADLRGRQGRWDDAWATVGRLRARRPDDPRGGYYVGRFAAMSGQRLDEGEQGLRRYLGHTPGPTEPSHAAAHWRLGMIAEHRRDAAAARREYEEALRLDPALEGAKQSLKKLRG